MKQKRSPLSILYSVLIFLFLYAPILVLMVYSFNEAKTMGNWTGFSLKWYQALFADSTIMDALWVTLSVAVISALAATILGTFAAIGLHSMKKRSRAVRLPWTWAAPPGWPCKRW